MSEHEPLCKYTHIEPHQLCTEFIPLCPIDEQFRILFCNKIFAVSAPSFRFTNILRIIKTYKIVAFVWAQTWYEPYHMAYLDYISCNDRWQCFRSIVCFFPRLSEPRPNFDEIFVFVSSRNKECKTKLNSYFVTKYRIPWNTFVEQFQMNFYLLPLFFSLKKNQPNSIVNFRCMWNDDIFASVKRR